MRLQVISLAGTEYEGEARSLNIGTRSGELTLLDHHRPLVSVLRPSTAHVIDDKGEKQDIEITSGFLEVTPNNKVNVLID
jgi:F-type H+-transporting ATPase subunit epsilon